MSGISFTSTYQQFIEELKTTFPEYSSPLTLAAVHPDAKSVFLNTWKNHTKDVALQNAAIFTPTGVQIVPGLFMTDKLWSELSAGTHAAIWKYLSSLILLAAGDDKDGLWDMSGFAEDMEKMMESLKTEDVTNMMSGLFEKLGKMAESFGLKDLSGVAQNFKIPERLYKGHIAKIAEELVREFKPEDFGITPEMLSSSDPGQIFNYLQEILTKKPELIMVSAQKIAKKIQHKFERGEIRREEILREAEELMEEFQENELFSNMFGSLGDMLKMNEKASGNEGSTRRREVQERLRKKAAEKEARKTTTATNTVTSSNAAALQAAADAAAALLAEEAAEIKPKKANKKK
jgi:hypothetical protein